MYHMGEPHSSNGDILYVFIYLKFKHWQQKSIWTVVRIIIILGRDNDNEGGEGNLL